MASAHFDCFTRALNHWHLPLNKRRPIVPDKQGHFYRTLARGVQTLRQGCWRCMTMYLGVVLRRLVRLNDRRLRLSPIVHHAAYEYSSSSGRGQHQINTLRWRHNAGDGVSNHQPHDCLLKCLFRRRSKETPKHRVTGLCAGNLPVTCEFSAQRASNAENGPIWWRHHVSPPDTMLILVNSAFRNSHM